VREGPTPDTTFPIGGNKYVRFIKNTTRVDQRSEKTMTDDKSFADGSAITPHPTTRYMLTRPPIAVVTKGIANEQCGEIAPNRPCVSASHPLGGDIAPPKVLRDIRSSGRCHSILPAATFGGVRPEPALCYR
jgi:hypothetical protein